MKKPCPILGVEVTGLGIGLPRESLTNRQYLDRYGPVIKSDRHVTPDDIVKWTGVESRYFCADDETLADLLTSASLEALRDAKFSVGSEIGKLLVGTATGFKYRETPGVHLSVQRRLSESGFPTLASDQADCACASFANRWIDGYRHFLTGEVDTALIAGGDTVSRMVDKCNPDTLMMADGAAALFMKRTERESGLLSYFQGTKGELEEQLVAGVGTPLEMRDGLNLARESARAMIGGAQQVLEWAGVSLEEVDLVVPHQANSNIIEMVRKRMKIPPERVVITVDKYGNTSSGSIPMAIYNAHRDGRIKEGDLVLATSVGTGISTETTLTRW